MPNFVIRTHRPGTTYKGDHLFILNKGMNSGKPLKEPCANCFVIQFPNAEEADAVYWLAYSMWKSKFWHPHLCGSVIPFIRLKEFSHEFSKKVDELLREHEEHKKHIEALKMLELREDQFHKNIALINDYRRIILYRYCKK